MSKNISNKILAPRQLNYLSQTAHLLRSGGRLSSESDRDEDELETDLSSAFAFALT